jgi:hypothetical protein
MLVKMKVSDMMQMPIKSWNKLVGNKDMTHTL